MEFFIRINLLGALAVASLGLVGCDRLKPAPEVTLAWMDNLPAAKAKAQAENKKILVNFTGSDWCGWCVRLRREVFTRRDFAAYATNKLVLVEIDFPRAKPQSQEQKRTNEALAARFQVEGFPTVLLLDSYGRQLGRTGYVPGGASAFLAEVEKIATGQISNVVDEQAERIAIPELKLKGISGAGEARMALINNLSLRAGESGVARSGGKSFHVRCVSIREHSVVVTIDKDDTPKELRLSGRL